MAAHYLCMATRFLLCISAIVGLVLSWYPARTPRGSLLVKLVLVCTGAAGIASWWLSSNDPSRLHTWEFYHHYLGARYYTELRYDGLYLCSLAALEQREPSSLSDIQAVRDLATNNLTSVAAILPLAKSCAQRFTPSTWQAFTDDVVFFKHLLGENWAGLFRDHGFNPSPIWVLVARSLIPDGPASSNILRILSMVDIGLLAAMWLVVLRCFPPAAFAVAAVFWGTNGLGSFAWTGGAFLRHDWLFATVVTICSLRKGYWSIAGALAAYATGVRIFPALLSLGVGVAAVGRSERRTAALSFARSFILTGMALLAISVATLGSDSWRYFGENIRKHVDTRAGNMVGLPSLVDNILECRMAGLGKPDGTCEPSERMSDSKFGWLRRGVILATSLAFLTWLRWISRRIKLYEAAILTLGFLPLATSASSYYFEVFLVFGLLCEQRWISVGLLTLGLALDAAVLSISPPNKIYLVAGLLVVQFVLLLPVLFRRTRIALRESPS